MTENNKKPVVIVQNPKKDNKVITKLEIEQENHSSMEEESDLQAAHESISINESQDIPDSFLNFVNSYSQYANQSKGTCLDMETVLKELNDQIISLKPPSQDFEELYKLLPITQQQLSENVQVLKTLPDSKLCQCIYNIEKLNTKLDQDFEKELSVGRALGFL